MKSEPTPGPWHFAEKYGRIEAGKGSGRIKAAEKDPRIIAFVAQGGSSAALANGYLLGAAWEMCQALEGIESTYVFLDTLTAGIEPQHMNTIKALEIVRAAIRKAKGE